MPVSSNNNPPVSHFAARIGDWFRIVVVLTCEWKNERVAQTKPNQKKKEKNIDSFLPCI